jgi:FAD/FMN-containing dehydrogenase
VLAGGAALAAALALPGPPAAVGETVLDDASGLNRTLVSRHVVIRPDRQSEQIALLRRELKDAAAEGRPVSLATARHSMGGQSLAKDGTALTFDDGACEVSRAEMTCRVTAGARWRQVIATLDPLRLSPAVMQSNNDFGAAGTFSVNAHGWPVPFGPFGTTVRRIELMLADGAVLACSRKENAELFRLAMGGYGLVGIVLELEIDIVENVLLRPVFDVMPSRDFAPRFLRAATGQDVRMAFGRLSVAREGFFAEALLATYRPVTKAGPLPSALTGRAAGSVVRSIYRAQVDSDAAKRRRWYVETVLRPRVVSNEATRNKLLNTPVSLLENRDPARTDILHEYFIPPERFGEFVSLCQREIPASRQELLNITLRWVAPDEMSVLAYAPGSRIAGVMAFAQRRSTEAEEDMRRLSERLIEGVLELGGSFYLPYRLHARRDQVARAYPRLPEFVEAKRRLDPGLLFRNAMWDRYWA